MTASSFPETQKLCKSFTSSTLNIVILATIIVGVLVCVLFLYFRRRKKVLGDRVLNLEQASSKLSVALPDTDDDSFQYPQSLRASSMASERVQSKPPMSSISPDQRGHDMLPHRRTHQELKEQHMLRGRKFLTVGGRDVKDGVVGSGRVGVTLPNVFDAQDPFHKVPKLLDEYRTVQALTLHRLPSERKSSSMDQVFNRLNRSPHFSQCPSMSRKRGRSFGTMRSVVSLQWVNLPHDLAPLKSELTVRNLSGTEHLSIDCDAGKVAKGL
jgi:hypothetical protein